MDSKSCITCHQDASDLALDDYQALEHGALWLRKCRMQYEETHGYWGKLDNLKWGINTAAFLRFVGLLMVPKKPCKVADDERGSGFEPPLSSLSSWQLLLGLELCTRAFSLQAEALMVIKDV
ncbi:hypothetical protein ACLB2K_024340 [Fragaria x ananassa]